MDIVINPNWNPTIIGKFLWLNMLPTTVVTVYVPIDAHCASADLRVRVYLKKKYNKNVDFFC